MISIGFIIHKYVLSLSISGSAINSQIVLTVKELIHIIIGISKDLNWLAGQAAELVMHGINGQA